MKIVSFLPSATEVLYALGLGDSIIGVSHDCDYPPEVRQKPIVSDTSVPEGLSSVQIHEAVGQTYHQGSSIYHLDPSFLRRERPDLIIAQELCQVCSVTSKEARRAAEMARSGARILSLEPTTLGQVQDSIRVLGEAVGRGGEAEALVQDLRRRTQAVTDAMASVQQRPRVFCAGWLDPLIAEGHWIPEMVEMAGGRDALASPGGHSRTVAWGEVAEYAPEVIFLVPCSFDLPRTVAEAHVLARLSGWEGLPAAQAGRVFAMDSGYFSRPGPRLATGLEIMARCLHPGRFGKPAPAGAVARLAPGARPAPEAFTPFT